MSIQWTQKSWCNVKVNGKNERRCWRWEGVRSDGRSFRITFIPHVGYICTSFNGTKLGVGKSLATAQKYAADAPGVKLAMAQQPVAQAA